MNTYEKNMLFFKEHGIVFKSTGLYGMPYEFDSETINIGISEWGFVHIYRKPIGVNSQRKAFNLHEIELTKKDIEFS